MRLAEYELITYETIHIPTRGEKQDFLQSSKSFWSCTHVNSCQNYRLYHSTYFIEYFMQDNFRYSRIKKIHQVLEKITRIDQESQNPLCLVIT